MRASMSAARAGVFSSVSSTSASERTTVMRMVLAWKNAHRFAASMLAAV
jgi:hypothetical protein